jgi:glucose/arabinose dehydrogenase
MKLHLKTTVALLTLAAWPAAAQPAPPAPSALETLGAMHPTGNAGDWPEVPQTGPKADQVKQNLTKIKMPPGFHISLYALVPDARHIAVGPQSEESYNHTARVCRVGPDNKLYIQLGQPYNVPAKDKFDLYRKVGMGGIIRMDRDGKNREVYAVGLRNPVGMDFNPKDKSLWTNDNQVDGMGDEQPPGELDRIANAGQDFGFPWYGGGHTRTVEYKSDTPPANVVFPEVEQAAHAADLGLIFYTGSMFPKKYQGAIFSTQHGSWNRTTPVGARLMVTYLKEDGHVTGKSEPFAEGWNENGYYLGRPVDVAQLADGSLLVSDDLVGALYRIWYDGK